MKFERGKRYLWDGTDEFGEKDLEPQKVKICGVPVIEVERLCSECGMEKDGTIYVRISSLTIKDE